MTERTINKLLTCVDLNDIYVHVTFPEHRIAKYAKDGATIRKIECKALSGRGLIFDLEDPDIAMTERRGNKERGGLVAFVVPIRSVFAERITGHIADPMEGKPPAPDKRQSVINLRNAIKQAKREREDASDIAQGLRSPKRDPSDMFRSDIVPTVSMGHVACLLYLLLKDYLCFGDLEELIEEATELYHAPDMQVRRSMYKFAFELVDRLSQCPENTEATEATEDEIEDTKGTSEESPKKGQ